MISINGLTVAYGGFTLLDNISFHISGSDKIGLVGKNGAGKSTLMKLICGQERPVSGFIEKPANINIGYLPQIMRHNKGRTVLEETLTALTGLNSLQEEFNKINISLSEREDYESPEYASLIERLNSINDILSYSHSEPPEIQAEKTLTGLGFKNEDLARPTETFSQGWNMRIELAKILLTRPDVLLLDEPTNHLDIESIEWLEDYLKAYRGALLLVSHDRRFLDNVTGRTVELVLGRLYDYKVSYSKYIELRQERIEQQAAAYENQRRMIEKTEDFIAKFRYKPTKSNQVQSRIKALEKIERIEIDETDNSSLSVRFPSAPRSGDVVFKAEGLKVGYPQKIVFSNAEIEIRRGEKVAFVGRNGEGKTTLMRVLAGELAPLGGRSKIGYNVSIGYFAQNQEDILNKDDTVFETLERIATGEIRARLRELLAGFLFKGEDIDKKVSVLSGGERARLGMAKLMLQPYNFLALDEPTNHMDIKSKEVLKQALKAYGGAMVVVSHDRDFLEGLVDKIYEFRDGKVKEHLCTVSDFLSKRKMENLQELERRFSVSPSGSSIPKEESERKKEYLDNKAVSKAERKIKDRIKYLENEITVLENEIKDIEKILAFPGNNDDILKLTQRYQECRDRLEANMEEWGSLLDCQ